MVPGTLSCWRAWLGCAVGMSIATACHGGPDIPEHPPRTPTAGRATLPPTPPLDPPTLAPTHPDGAWTVRGLLRADRKKLTGVQSVRGHVAAIQTCPLQAKRCQPAPHLYVTDNAEGTGQRLLVGGERDLQARGWRVGQLVTLQGEWTTASEDGVYFAPGGMLLLRPLDPSVPVGPDGSSL